MKSKGEQHYRWRFGAAEFDESALELRLHGKPVRLEPKPLKLLSLLLRNRGEVVTHDEIVAEVWEGRVTVNHTISTAIGKLRRALGDESAISIETVSRTGYRVVGEVERVAVGRVVTNRLDLSAGQAIPGWPEWVLVRQLVSTAYNDIWLVEHPDQGQERVVKFAVEGERLSRLKREAAVNRLLVDSLGERDDIVPVIDTNFSHPPFFLAYDREGQTLREWADDSGGGLARMETGERLALFLRICAAVSAAHQIGVLHKDIKPQNIFVVNAPGGPVSIKLADFGNSEMLEPEQLDRLTLTVEGFTVTRDDDSSSGTFMYMAPELLRTRSATVRSDLFALGVLLFQILIGDFRQPLTPGWRRLIDDELLIDDIARATDQDPSRRLASVDELAERIERLDERRRDMEQARRDQAALEQSRRELDKQRARRPWVLTLLVTLVIGLGVSVYLYREAEQGRAQAEAFVERMESVQEFLAEDIISRANPLNPEYEPDAGIVSILDAAAEGIQPRFGDSRRAAAALHRSFANAFSAFRRDEEALEHFERARTLYKHAHGKAHPTTVQVGYEQAIAMINAGEFDDAREFLGQIDRQSVAVREQSDQLAFRREFAQARLHAGLHDMQTALQHFETARDLFHSADLDAPEDIARVELGLVDANIRLGQPELALKKIEHLEGRADFKHLPGDIQALSTRNRARAYRDLEKERVALDYAERSVEEMAELFGQAHYQTVVSLSLVAQLQANLDDCEGTLATSQQVFELMRELHGADNSATLIEQANLGMKQFGCGYPDPAFANLRTSIDGLEEQFGSENRAVHQIRFFLARYLHESDKHRASLRELDQLAEVAIGKTDGLPVTAPEILLWRGRTLAALDRADEARSTLEQARQLVDDDDTPAEVAAKIDDKFDQLESR